VFTTLAVGRPAVDSRSESCADARHRSEEDQVERSTGLARLREQRSPSSAGISRGRMRRTWSLVVASRWRRSFWT